MKRFFLSLILMLSIFSITNTYSEEMHKEYYDSGKMLKESHFSNNKENGLEKIYYENGKISSIKNYKDGKADGEYVEYYTDGELKLKGRYNNGLRDGEFKTYLMNAKSVGSVFYKDGKEINSTLTPYMKEDVFFNFPDEMESLINTVSKKSKELVKLRDEDDGYHILGVANYPNGRVCSAVQVNDLGEYDGERKEYYESGQLKEKRFYINDKEEGKSLFYDEKGNLTKTEIYKNGVKQ